MGGEALSSLPPALILPTWESFSTPLAPHPKALAPCTGAGRCWGFEPPILINGCL